MSCEPLKKLFGQDVDEYKPDTKEETKAVNTLIALREINEDLKKSLKNCMKGFDQTEFYIYKNRIVLERSSTFLFTNNEVYTFDLIGFLCPNCGNT